MCFGGVGHVSLLFFLFTFLLWTLVSGIPQGGSLRVGVEDGGGMECDADG